MSSRKSNLLKFQVVGGSASGAVSGSMAADVTSIVTSLAYLDNVGIQLNWTGSPVGIFQIQISADHAQDAQGNVTVAGNWCPITLTYYDAGGATFVTTTDIPVTVGSPIYLDLTQLSAPWIRVFYDRTSGTGALEAFITAKQL